MVKCGKCRGMSVLGICAFFYIESLFGVVVFHRSMVESGVGWGLCLSTVYVYSSICKT